MMTLPHQQAACSRRCLLRICLIMSLFNVALAAVALVPAERQISAIEWAVSSIKALLPARAA